MSNVKYSFSDDGKTGYGWLSDGTRFLFDAEDFEKIRDINWYRNLNNGDTRRLYITTQSGVYLHRYIIPDVPSGYEVDHISLDTLDNRKCNLRVCTHQQNQCNQPLGYIILFSDNGAVIGRHVVDGKVTSLNSYLSPDSEYYEISSEYTRYNGWLADVDGSYGENDSGIFFFTTDGNYYEWTGTYLYTDVPVQVDNPIVYVEEKGNE